MAGEFNLNLFCKMAIEIERRFLLKNNDWKEFIVNKSSLEQGYIASSEGWIVRIREEKMKYKLTLKKHINKSSCHEFEYKITQEDGKNIFVNLKNKIKKDRFFLEINNKNWIVDCFKDQNFPLEIAEIELNTKNDPVILPSFLSKEITGLKRFSNFELSKNPYSSWI